MAGALQRSLIAEGIPRLKANEIVISKTVDICRSRSKNYLAKCILASKTFHSLREVITTFILENNRTDNKHNNLRRKNFTSYKRPYHSFKNQRSDDYQHSHLNVHKDIHFLNDNDYNGSTYNSQLSKNQPSFDNSQHSLKNGRCSKFY